MQLNFSNLVLESRNMCVLIKNLIAFQNVLYQWDIGFMI